MTGSAFVWVVFGVVAVNAGFYSLMASGGLVQADSWYFLDTFVRSYLDGTLSWRNFVLYRGGSDHVQVLPKVVLLFHLHYFDLDYKIEGLIGWGFGALGAVTLVLILYRSVPVQHRGAAFYVATAACVAVFLSLNSPNIYTWSLVTLGFMGMWFFLLAGFAAANAFTTGRHAILVSLAAALLCLTSDKFAILALGAVGAALLIQVRGRDGLRRWLVVVVALALPVAAMWALVTLSGMRPPSAEPPVQLSKLAAMFLSSLHPWREAILIPLGSGLVHGWQLENLPPWRIHVETALGILIAPLHLYFWWTIWKYRGQAVLAATVSCSMMLMFYAATAGILLNRALEFGPEYVRQPRYVAFYSLGVVACLIWFSAVARLRAADAAPGVGSSRLGPAAVLAASLLVLAVQVPISLRSWDLVKYVSNYQRHAAMQMGQLLADPAKVPPGCVDILVVCQLPAQNRAELMTLLNKHQLNLFSPTFQMRWGLFPRPAVT